MGLQLRDLVRLGRGHGPGQAEQQVLGGKTSERAVRADAVVVLAVVLDDRARLGEVREPVLVQALVPAAAVEAVDAGGLRRLAGLDVV
jgi:hypothetical protein